MGGKKRGKPRTKSDARKRLKFNASATKSGKPKRMHEKKRKKRSVLKKRKCATDEEIGMVTGTTVGTMVEAMTGMEAGTRVEIDVAIGMRAEMMHATMGVIEAEIGEAMMPGRTRVEGMTGTTIGITGTTIPGIMIPGITIRESKSRNSVGRKRTRRETRTARNG